MLQHIAVSVLCAAALFAQPARSSAEPSVRLSAESNARDGRAGVAVVAADSVGLDSLDISSPEADSSYHTQLSRSEVNKTFKRSFTLSELFPNADQLRSPVSVTATVRNTRGATASATVVVRPAQSK